MEHILVTSQQQLSSQLRRMDNVSNKSGKFKLDLINEMIKQFPDKILNTRVKIDTGKFCNARCQFCYYYDSIKIRDFLTLDEVKESGYIPKLFAKGITEFEFSGGEPTLCYELDQIIAYIKEVGKKHNIEPKFSVVSNGYFLDELVTRCPDITEVLISLHGDSKTHVGVTKIKDSYNRIVKFIEKYSQLESDQLPILIRINVVVTGDNLNNEFYDLLKSYIKKGIQINFLPLNFWSDASGQTITKEQYKKIYDSINWFTYTLDKELKGTTWKSLLKRNQKYKDIHGANLLNIRYAEICRLDKSSIPYSVSHYEHFFDKKDWNKIFYPNDKGKPQDSFYKKNFFFFNRELNRFHLEKTLLDDAGLSHYVDTVCKECLYFKTLKCDGIKYINQDTKTIYIETEEELNFRIQKSKGHPNGKQTRPSSTRSNSKRKKSSSSKAIL